MDAPTVSTSSLVSTAPTVQAAPPVYAIDPNPRRLGLVGRVVALAIALACISVLITAALVSPSPTGMGTHLSLGLQPCGWLRLYDMPCPSCGMTTSFAWFVRGNLLASLYVQPMGLLLAVLCAMTFWSSLYIALTARPAHRLLARVPLRYSLWPALGLALAAWGWKIWLHARGIDGW